MWVVFNLGGSIANMHSRLAKGFRTTAQRAEIVRHRNTHADKAVTAIDKLIISYLCGSIEVEV